MKMNCEIYVTEQFRVLFAPSSHSLNGKLDSVIARLDEVYEDAEAELLKLLQIKDHSVDFESQPTTVSLPKGSRTRKKKKLLPIQQEKESDVVAKQCYEADDFCPTSKRSQRRAAKHASEKITYGYEMSKGGTKLRRDSNYSVVMTKKKKSHCSTSIDIASDDTFVTAESSNLTSSCSGSRTTDDSRASTTYVQSDESHKNVETSTTLHESSPASLDRHNIIIQSPRVVLEDITNRQVSLGESAEVLIGLMPKSLRGDSATKDQLDMDRVAKDQLNMDRVTKDQLDMDRVTKDQLDMDRVIEDQLDMVSVVEDTEGTSKNTSESNVTLHQDTLNLSESVKASLVDELHECKNENYHLSSTAVKLTSQPKKFQSTMNLSPVVSLELLSGESIKSLNITPDAFIDPSTPYSVKDKIEYFNKKAVTGSEKADRLLSKGKSGIKMKNLMSETQLKKLNKRSISSSSISKRDSNHIITKSKLANLLKTCSDKSTTLEKPCSGNDGLSRTLESTRINKPKYMNLLSDTKTLLVRKPILTARSVTTKTGKLEERLKKEEEAKRRRDVLMEKKRMELKEKNDKRFKNAVENKMAVEKERRRQVEKLQKADHQKQLKIKEAAKLNSQLSKMVHEVNKTPKMQNSPKKPCKTQPMDGTYTQVEDNKSDVYDITLVPNTDEPDEKKEVPKWSRASHVSEVVKQNIDVDYKEIFGTMSKTVDLQLMFGKRKMRGRTSSAVWGLSPYRA